MKKIVVLLPEEMVERIDDVVRMGCFATRSEFIREAIRRMLECRELKWARLWRDKMDSGDSDSTARPRQVWK